MGTGGLGNGTGTFSGDNGGDDAGGLTGDVDSGVLTPTLCGAGIGLATDAFFGGLPLRYGADDDSAGGVSAGGASAGDGDDDGDAEDCAPSLGTVAAGPLTSGALGTGLVTSNSGDADGPDFGMGLGFLNSKRGSGAAGACAAGLARNSVVGGSEFGVPM